MSYLDFILLMAINALLAFLIAKYQQGKGYKLVNSWIGVFIGLTGLSLIIVKTYAEMTN